MVNVSHELQTPLAPIDDAIGILQNGAVEDSISAKSFLDKDSTDVTRLRALIPQLSDLTCIDSGTSIVVIEQGDVRPVILEAVQRLQLQTYRSGFKPFVGIPSNLPEILLDKSQIRKVITNLIDNDSNRSPNVIATIIPAE